MNRGFGILITLAVNFYVAACVAQSTNALNAGFSEWGESLHGSRLSIMVSNSIVFTNSELVVFVRMENLSTNTDYMGLSSPEQDFVVVLRDESGKNYRLTQFPWVHSMFTTDVLKPNESREREIHVQVDRYFPPPGIFPAKTGVPSGDYTLVVTRTFRVTKDTVTEPIQANTLKIQVK